MTNKNLIEKLQTLSPDKLVTIEGCDCEADVFDVEERTSDILIGREDGVNKPKT